MPPKTPPPHTLQSPTIKSSLEALYQGYMKSTPALLKIIDVYLVFMMYSGIVQFVYVVLAGSFPFNSFMAGFGSAVCSFVLGVSLRMQCNGMNKGQVQWDPQRAFLYFIVAQVILQFTTFHFMG